MVYYRLNEGDEEIQESYVPIGIVVVPTSHNVYENFACGVMSLYCMDYTSPDTGGNGSKNPTHGGTGSTPLTSYYRAIVYSDWLDPNNLTLNSYGFLPGPYNYVLYDSDAKYYYKD